MALDGNIIKERLKETFNGESQEVVARKLNMTQGSVSKLLTGKQVPTLETLYHIANIYGVSVDWIIGLTDIRKRQAVTEIEGASYADIAFAVTELAFSEGAAITETVEELTFTVNDPMAKALIKKGITLSRMDSDLYKNWLKDKLPLFKDRELIDIDIWQINKIKLKARDNLLESAWLKVHDEARDSSKNYIPF